MKSLSVEAEVADVFQKQLQSSEGVLKTIEEEYERYGIKGSEDEIVEWFHCLPIETLRESIDFENKIPRTKYSLRDMKHRFHLRKAHDEYLEVVEHKRSLFVISKIDMILAQIERIQNG